MHFAFACLVSVIIATHYYSQWPFDNIKKTGQIADPAKALAWAQENNFQNKPWFDKNNTEIWADADMDCWPEPVFCRREKAWMWAGQSKATQSFSILGLILVIVMSVQYFGLISCVPRPLRSVERARGFTRCPRSFSRARLHRYFGFKSLYMGLYKSVGDVQGIDYWAAAELHSGMKGYVPEVENADGNPWIACDMRLFDQDFIAWTGDHDAHNLYEDKLFDGMGDEVKKKLFSVYQSFDTPEKEGAKARMLAFQDRKKSSRMSIAAARSSTPWYRAFFNTDGDRTSYAQKAQANPVMEMT